MQLVCVQNDLVESRIAESQSAAFLDPCRSGFGSRDVDLVLTAGGNSGAEGTNDIFLVENVDETGIVLIGDKVTALGVDAFLQDVADLTEVGAERVEHCLAIFFGGAAGLRSLVLHAAVHGATGNGGAERLGHFGVHSLHSLKTLDLGAVVADLLLHLGIGLRVGIGKQTVFITAALHERFGGVPCLISLFDHFKDSVHGFLPPVFHEIEPLNERVGFDLG